MSNAVPQVSFPISTACHTVTLPGSRAGSSSSGKHSCHSRKEAGKATSGRPLPRAASSVLARTATSPRPICLGQIALALRASFFPRPRLQCCFCRTHIFRVLFDGQANDEPRTCPAQRHPRQGRDHRSSEARSDPCKPALMLRAVGSPQHCCSASACLDSAAIVAAFSRSCVGTVLREAVL